MFPVRLLFFFCCQSSCYEQFLVFGKCMAFYCAHCWLCRQQTTARQCESSPPPTKPHPTHRKPPNQYHSAAFGQRDDFRRTSDPASYTLRFRGAAHFTNAFPNSHFYLLCLFVAICHTAIFQPRPPRRRKQQQGEKKWERLRENGRGKCLHVTSLSC